jgi:ferredoxin
MRLSIDWDLCVGSGACVARAPGVFELVLGEDGLTQRAVLRGSAEDGLLRDAAEACPTLAIQLADESGPIYPPAPPAPPASPAIP